MMNWTKKIVAWYQQRAAAERLAYAKWASQHHPDPGRRGLYARFLRAAAARGAK